MPAIDRNGIQLYYEEKGSGKPLILLHGLGMNALALQREMDELASQFRVIAPDARGHGRSGKPAEYKLQDHIEDVIALMDHLHIEKAALLGGSMGSYIAQGVAIAVPNRIEKLILVSAKSNGKTSSTARLLAEHQDEVQGKDPQEQMQLLSKFIFHNMERVQEWMSAFYTGSPALSEAQQAASNKALENFDFRPGLPLVKARTMVIGGTYDGFNPPGEGKIIASLIPRAVFIEFGQSGHAPNVEEPERFIETVRAFLWYSEPRNPLDLIDAYLERLHEYSAGALFLKSDERAWSLSQLYEHLIVVAMEYLEFAESCIHADKETMIQTEGKTAAGELLFRFGGFPPVKIQLSDDPGNTPNGLKGMEELTEDLLALKQKYIELEKIAEFADSRHKIRHDGFGWLNAKEWVQLVEMHTRHHLRQWRELEEKAGIEGASASVQINSSN